MCTSRETAKAKIDRLIEAMERLTVSLQRVEGRYATANQPIPNDTRADSCLAST
jgi:hypothetical protein